MDIARVVSAYFSPTGATRKVAKKLGESLARELGIPHKAADITTPKKRQKELLFASDDLVVLATPTYAGRVPNKLAPELERLIRGSGGACVVATTFGNRNPDSSLVELARIAEAADLRVVGALSIPVRHAFTDKLATGHPDEDDFALLEDVAARVAALIGSATDASDIAAPVIRDGMPVGEYYRPLRADGEPAIFLKAKPVADASLCDGCGICAAACPVGSIDRERPLETPGICIKCQACVRLCPQGARRFDDPDFLSHVQMLEENYARPCEPEVYLGEIARS